MKSIRVSALLAAGAVAVISCGNENTPNKDNQSLSIVFSPTCGSPGDHVQIEVNTDQCATNGTTVFFAPHDDGIDSTGPAAKATVSGGAGDYTLDVVVPADAETGTLLIDGCGNLGGFTVESSSVFTIPCPGNEDPDGGITDGGDDTDASDGGDEDAPLAGLVYLHSVDDLATFDGAFWDGIEDWQAVVDAYLSNLMPGLPEGSCGDLPITTWPEPPAAISVGDVSLRANGTTLATFEPKTDVGGTRYGGTLDAIAPGSLVDLVLEGAEGFAATTLTKLIDVVGPVGVNSHDISKELVVNEEDLELTFAASDTTHRSLSLTELPGGHTIYCTLDASAPSFTFPKEHLEAGKQYVMTVRQGKLTELTFDGRHFVSVTATSGTFGVRVQLPQ